MHYNIYEALNLSVDFYKSYSTYESYRKKVTDKVLDLIKREKINSLCFFGVGNGCDMDYFKIMNQDVIMTLTDIDRKAMERAIHFVGIEPDEVRLAAFDYLGDCSDLINGLAKRLEKLDQEDGGLMAYHASIGQFYKGIVKKIENMDYRAYIQEDQDLVILLPIYTQILFVELVSKLSHIKRFGDIQDVLLQHMIGVIDRFNFSLVKVIKPEGYLFVLSDIVEIHSEDELFGQYRREVGEPANSGQDIMQPDSITQEVKKRIEEYENRYGLGLGSYGLLNLEEYMAKSEEDYYFWQFDEKRAFLVKGLVYHKQG